MSTNNVDKVSSNIFMILDDEDDTTPYEWDDMPEFVQEAKGAYEEVTVRFRNQADLEEFAKLIDQPAVAGPKKKTKKSIYYPAVDRNANKLLFWVDE